MLAACDGDADDSGVASECEVSEDCPIWEHEDETEEQLTCLTQFTGGYCGIQGCESTADCPERSICVAHEDGESYCFRECLDKAECNENRPEHEANCSSNFVWAEPEDDDGAKACIPPSSGV